MTRDKKDLDALTARAAEAEADPGRHHMEEAILATVAAAGADDPFRLDFARAVGPRFRFTRKDYRAVADALMPSIVDGVAADKVIILDALKKAGKEADVPEEVLAGILDKSKAVDQRQDRFFQSVARAYMKKLADLDRFRDADAAGRAYLAAVDKAREEGKAGDVDAAFGNLAKAVFDLAQEKRLVQDHFTEAEETPAFMTELKARTSDKGFLGLDCGFNHLNEVLNGLTQGLFIFAGAPSCGKTTLLKQVADQVAEKNRVPVLFFSYEQSAEELRIKSLSRLSGVNSRAIWKGKAVQEEVAWSKVEEAAEAYCCGPGRYLKVIEAGREDTVDRIRAIALMEKHKAKAAPAIVIDYLQLIPAVDPLTGRSFPSVRERVDFLCAELRRLARDLDAPILAVSTENRQAYTGNAKPSLVAFKESGGIEYSADAAFALWEDMDESKSMTGRFNQAVRRVALFCLKNRNGELARINLNFTPGLALFAEEGQSEELSREDALGKD